MIEYDFHSEYQRISLNAIELNGKFGIEIVKNI